MLRNKDSVPGTMLPFHHFSHSLRYFCFLCSNKFSYNFIIGSILVKVASSLQAYLQLSGKKVDMNSEVCVQEMAEAHKDDGVIITGKEALFCYVR